MGIFFTYVMHYYLALEQAREMKCEKNNKTLIGYVSRINAYSTTGKW